MGLFNLTSSWVRQGRFGSSESEQLQNLGGKHSKILPLLLTLITNWHVLMFWLRNATHQLTIWVVPPWVAVWRGGRILREQVAAGGNMTKAKLQIMTYPWSLSEFLCPSTCWGVTSCRFPKQGQNPIIKLWTQSNPSAFKLLLLGYSKTAMKTSTNTEGFSKIALRPRYLPRLRKLAEAVIVKIRFNKKTR